MSTFAVFKDFDKSAREIFDDDFDNKYSLKIKSAAPQKSALTTTINYDCKTNSLSPKLGLKWAHESGFTLEKLEVSNDGKITTETSLTGVFPNLKFDFKGNDTDKGDLSVKYSHPDVATVTADVDLLDFKKFGASVAAGTGPVTFGGSVALKKFDFSTAVFGLGASYSIKNQLFAGLRSDKNFTSHSAIFSYIVDPKLTFGLKVLKEESIAAHLGAVYKCNPDTTIKAKVSLDQTINLSVKQNVEKGFSVIGSLQTTNFSGFKFGVNATLG